MIVLFHTFYIVTSYILRIISKSISSRTQDISSEQETNPNFIICETNFTSEAEFESGAGIRFFPPVYVQRYLAVKSVLEDETWDGKIRKVVDFGCAEFGFFPYVKHISGIREVLTVDVDLVMLEHYCCRAAPLNSDYLDYRQEPLTVQVLAGSIADSDPRLLGTDAVICIELIEHLYPDTLEALPYTVFGFIQPLIAIFTTPNSDFNELFPNFTGFRHWDHKFEWTQAQFQDWAMNITTRYPAYNVKFVGVGKGPKGTEVYGCCSQMAVFVKLSSNNPDPFTQLVFHHEEEVPICEEIYKMVREYVYPFHVDNRSDEEKIRCQAEYYIRLLANNEKFCDSVEMTISVPLQEILPHVETWCNSETVLKNILEEAGWDMVESTQNGVAVVYPYFGECDTSYNDDEDFYSEEPEVRLSSSQVMQEALCDMEEDWDSSQPFQTGNDWGSSVASSFESQLLEDVSNVQLENNGVAKLQCDMQLQKDVCLKSQNATMTSRGSCKNTEDNVHTSSDGAECAGCIRSLESIDSVPVWNHESFRKNTILLQSNDLTTNLNMKDEFDIKSLTDFGSRVLENSGQTLIPFTKRNGHNALNAESSFDFEKCSNDEALKDHKSDLQINCGKTSSICSYSQGSEVIVKPNKVSIDQNSHCLVEQVNSSHQISKLDSLNVNLSSECTLKNSNPSSNFESLINVSQNARTNVSESHEMYLNFMPEIVESSIPQPIINQPFNFGSASSSAQESSQDRSLVESSSLDEQNDKAVDSGYPNSVSVQDMDMDLTPEQVDEISSESDEILTENSNLNSENSEYESESSEENDRIDNDDGLLFRFRNDALYDPLALVVENGDVANNNRDGEGNNAIAIIPPPPDPGEVLDPADHDLIPLLAAAEDFDNDNDLILPGDVQPFPHWLLHLLGLVNHGGGDLHNYIMAPVGDGGFIMPNENMEDVDEDDDSGAPSSSSSEMGDSEVGSEGGLEFDNFDDIFDDEILVQGDIGGGGEPDTFQGDV